MRIKTKMLKKFIAVLCAATMVASGTVASVGAVDPKKEGQQSKVASVGDDGKGKNKYEGRRKAGKNSNYVFHMNNVKRRAKVKKQIAKAKAEKQLEDQKKILKHKRTELINKVIEENKAQKKKEKVAKKQEEAEIRKQLEETRTFNNYGIPSGACLHLVLRLKVG